MGYNTIIMPLGGPTKFLGVRYKGSEEAFLQSDDQ